MATDRRHTAGVAMLMEDSDTPAREVDQPEDLLPGSLAASGASAERYHAAVGRGDPMQHQAQPSQLFAGIPGVAPPLLATAVVKEVSRHAEVNI